MPVQLIAKSKEAKKAKETLAKSATQETVDRMVELNKAIDPVKPLMKEYEAHRKFLASVIPVDAASDKQYSFQGSDTHVVEFSPCATVASITDMNKVKLLLGENLFMQLASIKITDLEKYLTKDQIEQVMYQSKTGARSHKIKTL